MCSPATTIVVNTFLVIIEAMPPTMQGPSMGCKSAPNASAEQVPGDVTLITVMLIYSTYNEFRQRWDKLRKIVEQKQNACHQLLQHLGWKFWKPGTPNLLPVLVAESQSRTSHHLHETQMTDMKFWNSNLALLTPADSNHWGNLHTSMAPYQLHLDRPNLVVESLVVAHRVAVSSILIALPMVPEVDPETHQSLPDHEEVGWYPGSLGTIQTWKLVVWRLHELPQLIHTWHTWHTCRVNLAFSIHRLEAFSHVGQDGKLSTIFRAKCRNPWWIAWHSSLVASVCDITQAYIGLAGKLTNWCRISVYVYLS